MQQNLNLGSADNAGDGDPMRVAFTKVEDNFTDLYTTKAPLASPAFSGSPTAPTAAPGTNTTQVATMAAVQAAVAALINSAPGALDTLKELADAINDDANFTATIATALALKAPLASPGLTGTPTAPTAAVDTNTTQLATTAMVLAQAASATPLIDGTAAVGTSTRFARADHVHPTDTSRAPVASPALTGTPTAPTADVANNSTQLATTAYVDGSFAAFTAVVGGSSGGTCTLSTNTCYYRQVGKRVDLVIHIVISNINASTGVLSLTLPITASAVAVGTVHGQELAVNGDSLRGYNDTTGRIILSRYNSATLIGNNFEIIATGSYIAA
jgi:hypothetical protein